MPRAAFMIAAGRSVKDTHAALGTVELTVTAAGTNQSTATALTADYSLVTTCSEGEGVVLPAMTFGDQVGVANATAANVLVYPVSGGKLNGQAANEALLLPPERGAIFIALNSTDCLVIY